MILHSQEGKTAKELADDAVKWYNGAYDIISKEIDDKIAEAWNK